MAGGSYTNLERTPVAGKSRRLALACEDSVTMREETNQSSSSRTVNTRVVGLKKKNVLPQMLRH